MKRSGTKSLILGNLHLVILFCLWVSPVQAQWAYTYGGSNGDFVTSMQQTADEGYIVAGYTESFGAGDHDAWVIKLDANGNVTWQKTYGGNEFDYAMSVQQTADGDYIVAGGTASYGAGSYDVWITKLDTSGAIVWQKTYGGSGSDNPYAIIQTSDNGFVVACESDSFSIGNWEAWIIKLDSNGNIMWNKTYGGTGDDVFNSIQQTEGGGYIAAGRTKSFGASDYDVWVLKLDENGSITWQKRYGGTGGEGAYSVQQTSEDGYIIAGNTKSFGDGTQDGWVIKLDQNGTVLWEKAYGGSISDGFSFIQKTHDGGFITAGSTVSFGVGATDFLLMKLDTNGGITWQKTFGGTGSDNGYVVQQTADRGYIVAGDTYSFANGQPDYFLLKLDSTGSIGSCPLKGISTALITDTSATVVDTNAVPVTSTATVADIAVTVTDTTASPTQICPAVLNVVFPNGGEDFITASDWEISWTPFIRASSFKAMYSLDNGATWELIERGITGTSTTWHTPLLKKNKTKCLVKVVGLNKKGEKVGSDRSDGPFKIEVLTITDINEGTPAIAGQTCPITWTLADAITPDQLQISYTLDGGTTWKKEDPVTLPLVPIYNWTAPDVKRDRTCKVKLTLKAAGSIVATATSAKFTINAP